MNKLKSDCLFDLEDKAGAHIDQLVRRLDDMSVALNRCILIAALIIAVAIVLATFISRPSGGFAL